jgi:hypothetical protein
MPDDTGDRTPLLSSRRRGGDEQSPAEQPAATPESAASGLERDTDEVANLASADPKKMEERRKRRTTQIAASEVARFLRPASAGAPTS